MAILDRLDMAQQPLGVRDLARHLDVSPATTQRLVNTLATAGFVEQDPATRRYSIGYRAMTLGSARRAQDQLLVTANRELNDLATAHQLNGYLAKLQGDRAIYLLCVQSNGPVSIRNVPGELAYLHSTAMGKALLASMTDDEARALLGAGPLPQLTPFTFSDPEKVMAQLADIRLDGYASVSEETILGVVSVGAVIRDKNGSVSGAISVAFAERSSPHLTVRNVAPLVLNAASRVSRALGHG